MNTQSITTLKNLSASDLLTFGLNDIAEVNGQSVFAIHAADGSQLAFVANREVGFAAMHQHELEPVSLH